MTIRPTPLAAALLLAGRWLAAEPPVEAGRLPRVPPTEPDKALATFHLKPGFRIELAAAEPLVVDPIALSFDENGRCYVVEMRDYSERRPERLGRIRRLEDTDGDGRFDKSTVFAADLPWPTAVICWDGGVFVGATPDMLYLKDTNRDGVADVREVIFSGFASDYAPFATNQLNVQAMFNSFHWSLDNRIHGASGGSGGRVRRLDSPFTRQWLRRAGGPTPSGGPTPPAVDLRGKDFSFDPRTLDFRAESGGAQYGLTFDNVGRKFVCSNSDHLQQVLYEERYAGRNDWFSLPSPRVSIAADGPAAPVFRRSPDEPWRVLRTRWRVAGLVPGPIEGGGRPSGYFTGATGATIYRGDALGDEFVGDAFIADCGSNLIHRKKLRPDPNSIVLIAERPPSERTVEFLASTDNWFRPVQLANAPDGALYLCDMYREVIEHPWSLPDSIKKHLDLNSGSDRGRIYRIVPQDFRPRPLPQLSRASTAELVALLQHPNGWHRDTAARLLYERQDRTTIAGLVQAIASSPSALGRLHSLQALDGLSPVKEPTLLIALADTNAAVCARAIKLSERFIAAPSDPLWQKLAHGLTHLRDPSVRFQLALTLGHSRHAGRLDLLGKLAEDGDSWIQAAVLNVLHDDAGDFFKRLYGEPKFFSYRNGTSFLLQLAGIIGARARPAEIEMVMNFALSPKSQRADPARERGFPPDLDLKLVAALGDGAQSAGRPLPRLVAPARLQPVLRRARQIAEDARWAITHRVQAVAILNLADYAQAAPVLLPLLDASHPAELQVATLKALDRFAEPELARELLQRWPSLSPTARREAVPLLLKRTDRIPALLAALEQGTVNPAELSAAQQAQLKSHRDAAIRERAEKTLGRAPLAARQSVVEKFQPALHLDGSAANGQKLFVARCATCHQLGHEGHTLGPDLATVKNAGKDKLLTSILDPSREVAPQFAGYLIETRDGEELTGLIAQETANSVTLRLAGGAETTVLRANIATLQSQGRSLMPDGLEDGLSAQDMADLLEFILRP
jgi:putative membrane-bound dehydrogenase-like protein